MNVVQAPKRAIPAYDLEDCLFRLRATTNMFLCADKAYLGDGEELRASARLIFQLANEACIAIHQGGSHD